MRNNKIFMRLLSNPQVIDRYYSPSISRTIPVVIPFTATIRMAVNEWVLVGFASGLLLFMSLVSGLRLIENTRTLNRMVASRATLRQEFQYWQGIVTKHQNYRDGYFQLALLSYQLGKREESGKYLREVVVLDPNFLPARALQEKLESKE